MHLQISVGLSHEIPGKSYFRLPVIIINFFLDSFILKSESDSETQFRKSSLVRKRAENFIVFGFVMKECSINLIILYWSCPWVPLASYYVLEIKRKTNVRNENVGRVSLILKFSKFIWVPPEVFPHPMKVMSPNVQIFKIILTVPPRPRTLSQNLHKDLSTNTLLLEIVFI